MLRELRVGRFRSLHIRRGDELWTHPECNTSVARVVAYIDCSIDASDVQPLLIHTDASEEYVQEVSQKLSRRGGTSDVFFVDAILRQRHPKDNFMVFAIELATERLATQRLVLRPSEQCRACAPAGGPFQTWDARRMHFPSTNATGTLSRHSSFTWGAEYPVPLL